jgi:predicted phage-related endonuclease
MPLSISSSPQGLSRSSRHAAIGLHHARSIHNRVRRINAVLQHPDPDKAWMLANIDREVISANDVQILECKTAGINGARLWKEGVPDYIKLQVMHQLAVTGKQAADVAVLIGEQELHIHRIERDEAQIAALITLERQFWHYVQTDTPPPADGSESADLAFRCLYPQDNGATVDFSLDTHLSSSFADLVALRAHLGRQQRGVQDQMPKTFRCRPRPAPKYRVAQTALS